MSDPRSEHEPPDDVLVGALADALYEALFDPGCDSEGAVWDDAVTVAKKVAARFEQAGWWMEWDGIALDPSTSEWVPSRRKELRHGGRLPGRNGTKTPVYRVVQAAEFGRKDPG